MKYSSKTKTIIFVFGFFITLFAFTVLLRYGEFKETLEESEATASINIMNIYQDSIEETLNYFSAFGEIKILSGTIRKTLMEHDKTSINTLLNDLWIGLKLKNPQLKDIQFYGANLEPIHSFSNIDFVPHTSADLKVKESYGSFFMYNGNFEYHIIVPAYKDGVFIGAISFVIDPILFLTRMNESLGVKTMLFVNNALYYGKNAEVNESCKYKLLTSSLIDESAARKLFNDVPICDKKNLILGKKIFLTHILNIFNRDGVTLAKFVFLQDVTQENTKLAYWIKKTVILYSVILVLTFFTLMYGFNILTRRLEISNKKLQRSEHSLQQLNKSLEDKVDEEIQKRLAKEEETREKERIIIRQDKLASMGEMIGNIAHQWRQPLTELGSILIRLDLSFEHGALTKESLAPMIEKSNHIIAHMSQTIDDFRNFFASEEKVTQFCLNDACQKSFDLMGASLRNHHIEFNFTQEKMFFIDGLQGEIIQAILNILANAKDILTYRAVSHPIIWFSIFEREGRCVIQIKDNGGGIKFEPVSKIFEPYITSKHANTGTGIGLYMTKTIIEKNSKGTLLAYNDTNGAVFEVIF